MMPRPTPAFVGRLRDWNGIYGHITPREGGRISFHKRDCEFNPDDLKPNALLEFEHGIDRSGKRPVGVRVRFAE